jgi:hypothetical protein
VYSLGFTTSLDTSPNLYYLTDYPNYNSNQLILKCIDFMLVDKYNNFIFYAHNFGGYDVLFIYHALLTFNLNKEYYILKTTTRDNTIIRLDIKINKKTKNNKNKSIKISFVDSLNLLNHSLDKICKDFNLDIQKGHFPHSFVKKNTLNYIGKKPDFFHFNLGPGKISINEYNKIKRNNWNLKLESLEYLRKDINTLYLIINEFSKFVYINFNVQLTDALTITRLALNIFKKKYYKNKQIPSINKLFLFNFIKEGYYGGNTEVYKPYGKDLLYLDINSLYPHSALNDLPGNICFYLENFKDDDAGLDLDSLFGFFYAKVKTNNQYLGLLPLRIKDKLIFPNGAFEGIWFSEELKFAKSQGYEIKVIKGYNFNRVKNIFDDYILDLYKLKKTASGANRMIYKSLLNNLLGRFGLNLVKPITKIVNIEKRDFILSTRIVHTHIILDDNNFLITYNPNISKEICNQHGLDFFKVLEQESKTNIENKLDIFKDVSVATAAMITSYARIYMNKIKLEVLKNGGKIYYSDTDSLVIDKTYFNPNWISEEIGRFKVEHLIKEAYFISNKTYCLVLLNGNIIIKTKGIINTSLSIEDFKTMYWNKSNVIATKSNTITNYTKGSILIEEKEIVLNYDSYTKREKLYNDEKIWIDTKPLVVKNNIIIDKDNTH